MISILLFSLFIGETFHFVRSAGTFTTNPPDLYGLASKSVFARRTKKVDGKMFIGGHSDGAVGTGAIGGFDFFIRKYPAGDSTSVTPLWTKMFGTSGTDYLGDFAVDAAGNVFAVGMCSGTVNSVATKGSGDACIFKLDSSGAILCSRQVGGTGVDRFNGVALDEANGYFFAVGNTTSASFDGASIVGKAAGIFYRFQMSDCAQAGTKYVQSMPLATQTMHFGGVVVLSTGQAVVGFSISTPTALPGSTGFNIAGYAPSAYANGGTFGFVKVNTTSGSAVPVQAISVAGTGGGLGAYANDIAIDAYETTYMSGHIMKSGASGMIYIKASKDFSQTGAGSVWGTNDVFVRGLAVAVDSVIGVVFFSGSAGHTTPGTSYTFQSSSYTAPIAFVLAYTGAATSFAFQGKLIHTNGGATEDIAELDSGRYLAVGSSYGGFNGVAGTGTVDMFTYQYNFTLNPTSMPTIKPTRSPSLVPTTTIAATPSNDNSASPTFTMTQIPTTWPTLPPSAGPTHEPTMLPTEDPTTGPTLVPTEAPTDAPTEEPTDFPVFMPMFMSFPFPMPFPGPAPIPMPIAMPMDEPTAPPLTMPTEYPSAPPSINPSVALSAMPTGPSPAPTNAPSALPTVVPTTAVPTVTLTENPTAQLIVAPSVVPTAVPSADPSTDPSAAPSVIPSESPSAAPSLTPSAVPSVNPSVMPSIDPSADPSPAPSAIPSENPSVVPSTALSTDPSADPTVPPTIAPTAVPTATPTYVPTARPTDSTVRNLVLDVTQTVYNLDVAIYNVQKAAYNVTFQQTISTTLDGIAAQSVTDIQVEQISPAGRIRVNADGTVTRCALTYTLTVYDAQVAFSVYRSQLVAAVRAGTMDSHFRHYAGMHGIDNSSYFGDVKVFLHKGDSSASRGLTNAEIAAIVVGSALGVTLLIGACIAFCGRRRRDDRRVYHAPIKSKRITPV